MKNILSIVFMVVLTLASLVTFASDGQGASLTDADIRQKIVGLWGINFTYPDGYSVYGSVTISSDGTFRGKTIIWDHEPKGSLTVEGAWEVRDGFIIETVTNSSDPSLAEVVKVTKDAVISLDDKQFVYSNEIEKNVKYTRKAKTIDADEWANPQSWSTATTIEGKKVKLRMYRRTESEASEIESAKTLQPNDGCSASYYYVKDGKEVLHGPAYSWKPGGVIEQKAFNIDGRITYLYRYYPTGEIVNSVTFDKEKNQLITSWYDPDGKIVGQYVLNNKLSCELTLEDNKYYWNGKPISAEEYSQKITAYMLISLQ